MVREAIIAGKWWVSDHTIKRCDLREIDLEKLVFSIVSGEILEDYPDDSRGHSCLILSYIDGRPVHTVCGKNEDAIIFITAYWPEESQWIDERTRRVRE